MTLFLLVPFLIVIFIKEKEKLLLIKVQCNITCYWYFVSNTINKLLEQ